MQDLHGYDSSWPAGGGVNHWNYAVATPGVGAYGLTNISVDATGLVTVAGTYNRSMPSCSFAIFLDSSMPFIAQQKFFIFDKNSDANNTLSQVQWTNQATGGMAVDLINLSLDTSYNIQFRVVMCDESIIPTAWSPYENLCPISGWTGAEIPRTGVNVWDEEWEVGDISSSTGANASGTTTIRTKNYISVKPGKTYYCVCPGVNNLRTRWYDKDKNYIGYNPAITYNGTFTVPDNAYYLRFTPQSSYGTTYNNDISINYPSTDHEYHAYTGDSISINWQDSAGTVYGGTIAINEDGSCKLTVDRAMAKMGDLYWAYVTNYSYMNTDSLKNIIARPLANNVMLDGLSCSAYKAATAQQQAGSRNVNGTIAVDTSGSLRIKDKAYNDANEWKTAMSNQTIVYPLATPIIYTLPDVTMLETITGTNNIWVNTGDITVTYDAYYSTRMGSFRPLPYNPTSLKQFNEAFIIPKYPN